MSVSLFSPANFFLIIALSFLQLSFVLWYFFRNMLQWKRNWFWPLITCHFKKYITAILNLTITKHGCKCRHISHTMLSFFWIYQYLREVCTLFSSLFRNLFLIITWGKDNLDLRTQQLGLRKEYGKNHAHFSIACVLSDMLVMSIKMSFT